MALPVIETLNIPLRRLLKHNEAKALLAEFEVFVPDRKLSLVTGNGRFFAGNNEWNQAEIEAHLEQVTDNHLIESSTLFIQPVLVENKIGAALVAQKKGEPSDQNTIFAFRSLHTSLTLILNQAMEKREVVRETLDRYREINLLYHIGETIGGCLNLEEISHLVLKEVGPVVPAEVGLMLLTPDISFTDEGRLEIKASFGPEEQIRSIHTLAQEAVDYIIQSGRPRIFTPSVDPNLDEGEEEIGTILCAPLKSQDVVFGVLIIGRYTDQPEFTAGDEKLVMALTRQAAIAIETARLHQDEVKRQRLEEELAIGRQIQLSLLPESCPIIPGWEFAAVYQAARQVGGDLYDFFISSENPGCVSMVIADVTGKGIPAALFMAFSRTIIRNESMHGRNPAAVLERANKFIIEDVRFQLFLSAFYATLDTDRGRLTFANAGHDWPLWLRAGGQIQNLSANGYLLGAFKDIKLDEREIQITPGDILVFFTDGITESRNVQGRFFGEEKLHEILKTYHGATAEQLTKKIMAEVLAFTGDTPQSDDLTLFVVKRQG